MKHIKIRYHLLLMLAMVFYSVQPVHAAENSDVEAGFYLSDEVYNDIVNAERMGAAMKQQNELLQVYIEIKETLTDEQLAGAYFDEAGELHVLVTEEMPMRLSNEFVHYETAEYSYAYLEELQIMLDNYSDRIGFTASGIDQEDNKVVIYSENDLDLGFLYTLVPQNALKIVEENLVIKDCQASKARFTVEPGREIYIAATETTGTVGCGVVWNNSTSDKKYGVLTAGHLGNVGDAAYYKGYCLGAITKKQQSGSVDAALILRGQNDNSYGFSHKVSDGKEFYYSGGSFPKNTIIYSYGSVSGVGEGKIVDTSISAVDEFGIKFTKLILTDATCKRGDSGGPVLTEYNGVYSMIGIIKGGVESDSRMVYVSMNEIQSAFDLGIVQ